MWERPRWLRFRKGRNREEEEKNKATQGTGEKTNA